LPDEVLDVAGRRRIVALHSCAPAGSHHRGAPRRRHARKAADHATGIGGSNLTRIDRGLPGASLLTHGNTACREGNRITPLCGKTDEHEPSQLA
jgi:hypothetical protein